jgi:phosphate butyryltransferase
MIRSLDEITSIAKKKPLRRIAIAAASELNTLKAARRAQDENLAAVTLVGSEREIVRIAGENSIEICDFSVVDEADPYEATLICCRMARDRQADVIGKGMLDSAIFLKAIMNRHSGLRGNGFLAHVGVFEVPSHDKIIMVSDAAVNIRPNLDQKISIIRHCIDLARRLGNDHPLVACICGIEKISPELMPETSEAAILAQMNRRGQISGCTVDGPLALDNAINGYSAKIKNCKGPVAGDADIILTHDLNMANVLYKSLIYFARARAAAAILGGDIPIAMTSRADDQETKFLSMALSIACI